MATHCRTGNAMVRSRILIFAGFVCCFCTPSAARATATVIDSSGNRMGWEIVSRLNSAGHFPFTGSIVNRHVNADINIALEYQRWGLFLFKSHDLEQRDSPVNYFQPGVFRSISITPDIDVRFFFGYVFSQASSFRDPDSDFTQRRYSTGISARDLSLKTAHFFSI